MLYRLVTSGLLAELQELELYLIYIQVDNFLAPVDDPDLIGTALAKKADVVTKVLPKANPDEKVGHLVKQIKADGNSDRIVEYTELTPEQTRLTDPMDNRSLPGDLRVFLPGASAFSVNKPRRATFPFRIALKSPYRLGRMAPRQR